MPKKDVRTAGRDWQVVNSRQSSRAFHFQRMFSP